MHAVALEGDAEALEEGLEGLAGGLGGLVAFHEGDVVQVAVVGHALEGHLGHGDTVEDDRGAGGGGFHAGYLLLILDAVVGVLGAVGVGVQVLHDGIPTLR